MNDISAEGVEGLDGEIVIRRDEWGIPHVGATTARDAFFAQGFVQAADRLGQLEYDRRRAGGRWAEVAGIGAASFDVFVRRCGLALAARREYDALDPAAREVLDAFAAGVNAFLAFRRPLPPDLARVDLHPTRWEPWDCCAVFLVRHVVFANWQKKLWRGRAAATLGAEAVARLSCPDAFPVPLIVPPDELFRAAATDPDALSDVLTAMAAVAEPNAGSNSWALSGARTASGAPLVAGDPHRFVEVPGVYAQGHLTCPDFDAAGLSFVGVPGFPHFGRTDHVAWCVTNANGDYQDLFVERFEQDATPARREIIEVRGSEAISIECYETPRGPVVFGDPSTGIAISMRSTALVEPSPGLSVVRPMLLARTVDELDDVMRSWVDPVNNFVSADVDGAISYRTIGTIPIRALANAWGPVPGWTGEHDWHGTLAYDDLPRVKDPDGGVLVTANQRIVDADYPHFLGLDYARPDRAIRIRARLDELESATVDDMAAVHRDRQSLAAGVWVEHLLTLTGADEWERDALDRLRAWDRTMDADSVAATVYVVTRDAVGKWVTHQASLAPLRAPLVDEPSGTFQPLELRVWAMLTALLAADDRTLLPGGSTWSDALAAGLTDAVALLRTSLGDDADAWHWGSLHVSAPTHPLSASHPEWGGELDPPAVPVGGEWDTVFSTAHPAGFGFWVTSASVARYVFDLADRSNDRWIVPLGASGDATSEHFADQQVRWAAGELVAIRSWAELERDDAPAVRLSP